MENELEGDENASPENEKTFYADAAISVTSNIQIGSSFDRPSANLTAFDALKGF